jgi:TonB family protein
MVCYFLAILLICSVGVVARAANQTSPCSPKDVPALTPENLRSGKIKSALVIYAPKPDYPKYARDRGWTGTGCFVMHVDQKSGRVKYVEMLQSTGHKILDDEVIATFSRWRFGPGVAPKVAFPITFSLTSR